MMYKLCHSKITQNDGYSFDHKHGKRYTNGKYTNEKYMN